MSCNYKNLNKGGSCCSYWPGGVCADGSNPVWSCANSNACCPNNACPTKPQPSPQNCTLEKGCEKYCGSNLMSDNDSSVNKITSINISNNKLIINYKGGSPSIPNVNPWPGSYGSKVMWLYACPSAQGLACLPERYSGSPIGMDNFVKDIISSRVNFISLICNNSFKKPENLGVLFPSSSANFDTSTACASPSGFSPLIPGSEQNQTTLAFTVDQLKKLHDSGITIVVSIGSWMSDFPRENEWTQEDFDKYVERFECIRCASNYTIDGLDFDLEGSCPSTCKYENCNCGWWNGCKGDGDGTYEYEQGKIKQCYRLPNQITISVMNGIAKAMKNKGYVVTAVPPTNTFFSGRKDASEKYNGQNQFVKYGLDFSLFDGFMLQFYTGFDAGMCGPKYELCKANNITNLNELTQDLKEYESNEPGKGIDNQYGLPLYPNFDNRTPLHCPRKIDCPDWKYEGEEIFESQVNYFRSLSTLKGVDAKKLVLGLEFYYDSDQWGPFPSPVLVYGLNKKLQTEGVGELGGLGGWTIAGTFGQYKYPNKPPPITSTGVCDCETPKGGKGGLANNMWCLGEYYGHFETNIVSCWGNWGRYNKDLTSPTDVCRNIKAVSYCNPTSNNPYGTANCLTIPKEQIDPATGKEIKVCTQFPKASWPLDHKGQRWPS